VKRTSRFADAEQEAVYTPAITLWAFLSQVVVQGRTTQLPGGCSRVIGVSGGHGTGSLLEEHRRLRGARAKIPTTVIHQLETRDRATADKATSGRILWLGRRREARRRFTVSMRTQVENQKESSRATQKTGLGFPLARCVRRSSR